MDAHTQTHTHYSDSPSFSFSATGTSKKDNPPTQSHSFENRSESLGRPSRPDVVAVVVHLSSFDSRLIFNHSGKPDKTTFLLFFKVVIPSKKKTVTK